MSVVRHFRELRVYREAFDAAMLIFECSKQWPKEERYSLTDQIRRSSRSICVNIGEAWRKTRYPAHFVSKLTDADAEATETMIWLDFSLHCEYLGQSTYKIVTDGYEEIGKMLGSMISSPEKFCYEGVSKKRS